MSRKPPADPHEAEGHSEARPPQQALSERFAEFHALYRDQIRRYLERMTRDPALAEDLTQETFFRASRGLPGFRGDSKPATWLYRIATNAWLDHWRRKGSRASGAENFPDVLRDPSQPEAVAAPLPALPDRLFEDSEMGTCIREFVDSLPPAYRAVIILHDLEGLTNAEVATVLDCSLETVKIRVHRAREKLRDSLSDHCHFDYSDDGVLHCDRKQPTRR